MFDLCRVGGEQSATLSLLFDSTFCCVTSSSGEVGRRGLPTYFKKDPPSQAWSSSSTCTYNRKPPFFLLARRFLFLLSFFYGPPPPIRVCATAFLEGRKGSRGGGSCSSVGPHTHSGHLHVNTTRRERE